MRLKKYLNIKEMSAIEIADYIHKNRGPAQKIAKGLKIPLYLARELDDLHVDAFGFRGMGDKWWKKEVEKVVKKHKLDERTLLTEAVRCPKCKKMTNVTYAQRHGKHDFLCDKCEDLKRQGK